MKRKLSVLLSITLAMVFMMSNVGGAGAQGPGCTQGECPEAAADKSGVSSGETDGLALTNRYSLRGGYVAAGTGLRNRGYGTIVIKGIPRGAKVYKAFLYWNILDYQQVPRHQRATFQGQPILGTYIGADRQPCWLASYGSSFSYRADVTGYVTGNKSYQISGIASSRTDGADPWSVDTKSPLAEGASLVVIYTKSTYPLTEFFIWDGAASVSSPTTVVSFDIGPFTATNPVGAAYTTFIGADGQDASEPASQINGFDVLEADWDGTDPQEGANFQLGNLWDTDTASVGKYLRPWNTIATVTVKGGPDCLVWVAQVFSISSGTLDSDGDALLNGWEANGYDQNGDFIVDVDLPAMGASPWHKDIFVEHDWMVGDHSHQPSTTVLDRIKSAYAMAPVSNPDGAGGIKLHNDYGQAPYSGGNSIAESQFITTVTGCSTDSIWAGFDVFKIPNFAAVRQDIFHYVIWGHDICPENAGVSGIARGIPSSDFLVTLGSWPSFGTEDARSGTFMHELGHNLGLTHGGNTGDHVNYKPNHLSIMNYSFQVIGVWRSSARRWDYTRLTINALNENDLNETTGLDGSASLASYGTRWFCGNTPHDDNTADTNVDWNCNGSYQASVSKDINKSGDKTILGQVHNQWLNVIYNGGTIGAGVPSYRITPMDESIFVEYPCLVYKPR